MYHPAFAFSAHKLKHVNETALGLMHSYIEETSTTSEALSSAREAAQEFGLAIPDGATGQLLSTLACATRATNLVAASPAADVIGLYLLDGAADNAVLSCIDPEPEHHKRAKTTLHQAGYSFSQIRSLPSRPLDVLGRLANNAYQVIYADIAPVEFRAFIDAALPLLTSGGVLVLSDSLLDGTLADASRKDRDTVAARDTDEYLHTLDSAIVTRLPLGAGITLITKR
ncbi:putative methyltransferase [Corynebacterium kutscheri]|uniref:Methyltransferase n=2 Tax=Corynebacterium kutscheri TaxID=35755 RepID=A0A0F6R170_9CORY|nr:putative O-methyltransferase [Corynebacterium kutscheri]VEH08981.1 putative methyltransferase [Corynebacterium kutscheri]VEH10032.1 putative methyltransferase [Corynebacterium kutscheri]VEH80113.1 putative methyltransferase [Corynebacterium kutscheri]